LDLSDRYTSNRALSVVIRLVVNACRKKIDRRVIWGPARVLVSVKTYGTVWSAASFSSLNARVTGWRLAPPRRTREEDDEKVRLRYCYTHALCQNAHLLKKIIRC
jgi:hypothetical protein